ncbi:hyaluronidase-1-like [Diadema antillarum]|uniref:hyaluronidase-1-like n=1 Tax=Diadema antillarum TaxID=105358 RepID=UPI003A86DE11
MGLFSHSSDVKSLCYVLIVVLLGLDCCISTSSTRKLMVDRIAGEARGKIADTRKRVSPKRPVGSNLVDGSDPFRAVWNLPNHCGDKFGVDLPLAEYGIEFNSNHNWNYGNVVSIFYNRALGLYPHYEIQNGKSVAVNKGLPQLGNITQHLEKAAADVLAAIPDPDFSGVGVIDWESWRPQWEQDFDTLAIYRNKSLDHVRASLPYIDDATVEMLAQLEWTQAAKLYMESTLMLVKKLRPKAMWGYYSYPYCYDGHSPNMTCTETGMITNNNIMWLFNISTALYPSIYLHPRLSDQRDYVKNHLKEAFRLRERSSDPKGPIFSYARFNYSNTGYYYSLEDLNNTILLSAEMGTNGVVFWGDNNDDRTMQTCKGLQDYIRNALGPVVAMSRKGAATCSARVCSGNGRCVGNILTCGKDPAGVDGGRYWTVGDKFPEEGVKMDVCSCRCFRGWTGKDCSIPETQQT